ncbi:glycosyltransferase [Gillisia hiemivivida]|uniref:Glycosyltransferase n=1 Tax=Gillisia hiemivivida TaxID=291190 RepID=A0A5C6ZVF1_9FLAO|nr:glycosyltransferase [Gillisia hiemivivida]TXD93890.1 glycosyltransferase [Gillisia hiemivivida]
MSKICIIIPCFNEEERINLKIFSEYIESNSHNFYFINDGSFDNTLDILEELKKLHPDKVKVIDLSMNYGKAEAVRQGILKAAEFPGFDYIGYLDADLATPLQEIDYLTANFSYGYKFIMGSRVKRLGATIERDLTRHYMGRIFATVASIVLKLKPYDSQCGAKFFEVGLAQELFSSPFASKWLFDLELLFRYKSKNKEDYKKYILEVPLRLWKEKEGSKIKLVDFFIAPLDLIKIRSRN